MSSVSQMPSTPDETTPRRLLTILDLPTETIEHIFGYLSTLTHGDFRPVKIHLYRAALTCRLFAQVAVPRLWYELEFHLDEDESHSEVRAYQRSFLKALCPTSLRHFRHTRKLTLSISLWEPENAVELGMETLLDRLLQFLSICQAAGPYLKYLYLKVEPFVESNFLEAEWPAARSCNQIIYYIVGQISLQQTNLEDGFYLDLGTDPVGDVDEYRPHVAQILSLLGPKITKLELNEKIPSIVEYLPTMEKLHTFCLRNAGEPDEAECEMLWRLVSPLPVTELLFVDVGFLPMFNTFVPPNLRSLVLNGVDDIISACVVCYTQLPELSACVFNQGKVKDDQVARETVLKETICTRLNFVSFRDSFAPAGIVSTIAKKNPRLHFCGAPINISDEDISQLQLHCPISSFYMTLKEFDALTPRSLVSVVGLLTLSRMPYLEDVVLRSTLLNLIDFNLLSQWAWVNKTIENVEFGNPNFTPDVLPSDIKPHLSGDDSFKEWMVELVTPVDPRAKPRSGWKIHGDRLRDAIGRSG
jgi:hypothetical protein